jgi:hypothetical protein
VKPLLGRSGIAEILTDGSKYYCSKKYRLCQMNACFNECEKILLFPSLNMIYTEPEEKKKHEFVKVINLLHPGSNGGDAADKGKSESNTEAEGECVAFCL